MFVFFNSILILIGVLIMALSIFKVRKLLPQLHNAIIKRRWNHLVLLMFFFLCGYVVALLLVINGKFELLSAITSVIFSVGALFVFLVVRVSVMMGSTLLSELSERKKVASLLQAVIESTADGILVVDRKGKIVNFNQKFIQMWSLSESLVATKDDSQAISFVLNQLKYPEQFVAKVQELYSQPSAISNDVLEFKNGKVFERYSQPQELDGQYVGRVWSFSDVTARNIAEIEVKKLNKELEQKVRERTSQLEFLNNDLESFNYSISHDLRAPLRAINGFTQILKQEYENMIDEKGKNILHMIIDNTNKMGELIDDLLDFSRLGRKEIKMSAVDTKILVDTLIKGIDRPQWNEKATFVIKELLPIYGDPSLIQQLFFNVITNALKYSRNTANPVVEIGSYKLDHENIFYVKDNGIGFEMKYYGKLFKVFQRLVGAEAFEGTGVGLAIVHRIVTRHGGKVWAEGKLNEGATFYFSLPDFAGISLNKAG